MSSGAAERLKDEVGLVGDIDWRAITDHLQGTRRQVVLAGAISGLVSRYVPSFAREPRYKE